MLRDEESWTGVEHEMSDAVLPRSDLRRGRIGLAVRWCLSGYSGG